MKSRSVGGIFVRLGSHFGLKLRIFDYVGDSIAAKRKVFRIGYREESDLNSRGPALKSPLYRPGRGGDP